MNRSPCEDHPGCGSRSLSRSKHRFLGHSSGNSVFRTPLFPALYADSLESQWSDILPATGTNIQVRLWQLSHLSPSLTASTTVRWGWKLLPTDSLSHTSQFIIRDGKDAETHLNPNQVVARFLAQSLCLFSELLLRSLFAHMRLDYEAAYV